MLGYVSQNEEILKVTIIVKFGVNYTILFLYKYLAFVLTFIVNISKTMHLNKK